MKGEEKKKKIEKESKEIKRSERKGQEKQVRNERMNDGEERLVVIEWRGGEQDKKRNHISNGRGVKKKRNHKELKSCMTQYSRS